MKLTTAARAEDGGFGYLQTALSQTVRGVQLSQGSTVSQLTGHNVQ
jgi:hypothetical protein